jgi:transcriptional regulator with XRE-family HTH domain
MTLGNSIRLVRTSAGMRQYELAAKLGVTSNYISLLECDRREPSISFLKHLGNALNVPPGIFFLWQEFNQKGATRQNLKQIHELLVRLEAMYLASTRKKSTHKRSGT